MKKIFQLWLVFIVVAAFGLTLRLSYQTQSRQAQSQAKELLLSNLADAERQLKKSQENLAIIREITRNSALAKVRALAGLVYENPSIALNQEALAAIRSDLDVDEVCVTEGKVITGSIPDNYIGYDMSSSEQAAEFLPAIENKEFSYIQKPMINGHGKVVQYAGVARIDKPGIIQIAYEPTRLLKAEKVADIKYIADNMRIGKNGKIRIQRYDEIHESYKKFLSFEGAIKFASDDISFHASKRVGDYVVIGSLPNDEMYLSRDNVIIFTTVAYSVLFTIIFFLISALLQKIVINGIYSVNSSLGKITDGNLNEKVEVKTTSEFEELSEGINATVETLKLHIEKEAKRIDDELKIGHDIQCSVLPKNFPNTQYYTVYADMFAAKEVGGDFYDLFTIGPDHLGLIIADVSGKGLTAALYMMTAKTLIRELLLTYRDAAEAVGCANAELVKNRAQVSFMFVTAFVAVLNTKTGELCCVNAGHNPPLVKKENGKWEYQKIKHSVALGVSKKAKYENVILNLNENDAFFMYTDGVTEAMNSNEEQFGEERLKVRLDSLQDTKPEEVIKAVKTELADYRGSYPQSDDITMVMLKVGKLGETTNL